MRIPNYFMGKIIPPSGVVTFDDQVIVVNNSGWEASGSSFDPYYHPILFEHEVSPDRTYIWECIYCHRANHRISLECCGCGAGRILR